MNMLGFQWYQFDYSVLEKNFFGTDSKLASLVLHQNSFLEINDDAFEGLGRLNYLYLTDSNLEDLSPDLLRGLVKLKKLNLSGNKLQTVPCESIPVSVEHLVLSWNKIDEPSF